MNPERRARHEARKKPHRLGKENHAELGLDCGQLACVKHTTKQLLVVHRLSGKTRPIPLTVEEEAEEDEDL